MTRRLLIDIETYCEADLAKVGVYRYASDPSFRILLFGYQWLDQPSDTVRVVDLTMDTLPGEIRDALTDPHIVKVAHNANFERVCLTHHLAEWWEIVEYLDPAQWDDTMVMAAEYGLPMSLANLSEYLHTGETKSREGKALIARFSQPYRGTRVMPYDDPQAWARFVAYCAQDIKTEASLYAVLPRLTPQEHELWVLDQLINDRGVMVESELAHRCTEIDDWNRQNSMHYMRELTGLDNPNSGAQLKAWLDSREVILPNLLAATVDDAIARMVLPRDVCDVLELRRGMNNSSVKKYQTMLDCAVEGCVHGLFQFHGAHTGRWAGRLVQVQNLPRGTLHGEELDKARNAILSCDHGESDGRAHCECENVNGDVLKSLIRTALIPSPGKRFIVADFSAIEARVLAWLAGEDWVLDAFRAGEDIYRTTAARMARVPLYDVTPGLRQRGKVAVLACGYGGGVGAMRRMGGESLGMSETEMQSTVTSWRESNRRVCAFWRELEKAVRTAWRTHTSVCVGTLFVRCERPRDRAVVPGVCLAITLPSGRTMTYQDVKVSDEEISYAEGGARYKLYGGLLTENVVQAVARDILAEAMLTLDTLGQDIVMHVHDEVVIDGGDADIVRSVMNTAPMWAAGLPLASSLDEWDYYQK